MKFAFSTVSCPKWDYQAIVDHAKEYGYEGVEIRGFLNEAILTASNVFLSDPSKVREIFHNAGIQIPCLATSIAFTGRKKKDAQLASDVIRSIDTAAALASPMVKIFDTQVRPGQSRAEAGANLARWLSPLADYAATKDITLLIENALSFRNAKELWLILEMIQHPAVGICWDVFNAAAIGETPAISIPTLNNRIQYVQVKDATLGALGASFCKLGEGNVRLPEFFRRLKGIGYTGWATVEWEKAWLPNLAEPEEILPDAIAKLKEWTKPQMEEEAGNESSDAHPGTAKAAAK
jgi:sugar phosphate isomerase/epimerase